MTSNTENRQDEFEPTRVVAGDVVDTEAAAASTGQNAALDQGLLGPGTRLFEFEITSLIGQGGFGVVYEAWDHALQRTVAIKEYLPSSLSTRLPDGSVQAVSERNRETFELGMRSFINEARLLAQFDHPSLLKVYRFWEERGTSYMVMPLYRGQTLRDALQQHSTQVDGRWLLDIMDGITQALAVMHSADCFHRDIAPDNIMLLEGTGRPVVLDFGAARRVITDKTQAITVILKPGYAPVEQYAEMPDMKQGPWTDVYALAAVMHTALCGKPPPPSVARIISDTYIPLSTNGLLQERYGPQLLAAIDSGLAVRPEQRIQSMQALRVALGLQPGAVDEAANATVILSRPVLAAVTAPVTQPNAAQTVASELETRIERKPSSGTTQSTAQSMEQSTAQTNNAGKGKWLGAGAVVLVLLAVAIWWSLREPQAPASVAGKDAGVTTSVDMASSDASRTDKPTPPEPEKIYPRTPLESLQALKERAAADFVVSAKPVKARVQIGKDPLSFQVRSERAGYVYVYLLSSGGELIQLFPNQLDRHNRIAAGETFALPRASWPMNAGGPAGANEFAVLVSALERDFADAGAQNDGMFPQFNPNVLVALEAARGSAPTPLLGKPVCPTSGTCDDVYGVTYFSVVETP